MSKFVTRPFRFGVVCPLTTDLRDWRDRVRRIADNGYSTILMPDVPGWQPAQRRKQRNDLRPAVSSCSRLLATRDGKEGVDGSSPSEGLQGLSPHRASEIAR